MLAIELKVELTEIQLNDAVRRLTDLVRSSSPDGSANTVIKSNYDDIMVILKALEDYNYAPGEDEIRRTPTRVFSTNWLK